MSRILLVRMDGLGDALVLVPLVAALRAAGHEVGALLTGRNAEAFSPGTLAFEHVVEREPWPKHGIEPRSEAGALAEARLIGYDVALVASEEPAAYRFAKDAGIARRVGFINGWEKPFKSVWSRAMLTGAVVRPASASRETQHEVVRLFALGAGLHGEAAPSRDPGRLRSLVVDTERAFHGRIVLQASPKFAADGLGVEAMAEIAAAVARDRDVVLCESAASAAFASEVSARAGVPLMQPGVAAWKRLIDGARAVVTPDSGAAHVAGMTGTPCVDLFARTPAVERDMDRWRPWAAPARTLSFGAGAAASLADRVRAALDEVTAAAVAT